METGILFLTCYSQFTAYFSYPGFRVLAVDLQRFYSTPFVSLYRELEPHKMTRFLRQFTDTWFPV